MQTGEEQEDAGAVQKRRGKDSTREASSQESQNDSDTSPAKKKRKKKTKRSTDASSSKSCHKKKKNRPRAWDAYISTRLKRDGRFRSLEAELKFRREESQDRHVRKMRKRFKRQALNSNDEQLSQVSHGVK